MKSQLRAHGLFEMGRFHDEDQTLILIGAGRGFWTVFQASPEYRDRAADPLDRWSKRVIGDIARAEDAEDIYPSDGPPYAPFIAWALRSGRFWQSPTGMMVHDAAGLMISIRGALRIPARLVLPPPADNPCDACADKPCISACPVDALSDRQPYDVPGCKDFLATPAGHDCMVGGCRVRVACPVSQSFDRCAAQSAFHMRAFVGGNR